MQVPSDAKGTPPRNAHRKRGYTTALAATRMQRSISLTESPASDAVLPPIQGDGLPILVLNPSSDLDPQPQPASTHEHPALVASSDVSLHSAPPPTLFSNLKNPYLTSSPTASPALSSTRLSSQSAASDVYSVRWKMNALDILIMLRRATGLIRDVKHRFTNHRNVLIGSELVSFLVSRRLCSTRNDAVDLCNHLVMDDILQHEFQEHIFKDKYLFYVITPDAESNACAIGFIDESDDDDDDDEMLSSGAKRLSLSGFARRPSAGHSLLARSLMRQSIAGKFNGNHDYLNDASLQDDLVAEAAADRYSSRLCYSSHHNI